MLLTSFHALLMNLPILKKTERTMFERTKEHVTRGNSTIKGHFDNFSNKEHLYFTHNLIMNHFNNHEFSLNLFRYITKIIDPSNN